MSNAWKFGQISIVFATIFYVQGALFPRAESSWLLGLWSGMFLLWGWSNTAFERWDNGKLMILGLSLLSGLAFLPNLSDDYFRFLWDGHLLNTGENPFVQLPCFYEVNEIWPGGLTPEIYEKLNSPRYYTVYPPLNQLIFSLATLIFPGSIWGAVGIMKAILLLSFLGTVWISDRLLRDLGLPNKRIYLLAFMPLLWIEWIGNLHFEGLMVFFLLMAIWMLHKHHHYCSAFFFGLAVSVKLIPLIFLPFLLKRIGWKKTIVYGGIVLGVLIFPFLLFYHQHLWANYSDSLNLYFRNFEFNASIYYVLRFFGMMWYGYNPIHLLGPWSAVVVIAIILWMSWRERTLNTASLIRNMVIVHSLYLFLSTTVHPWYLSAALVLSIFTDLRYTYLWGATILLSYVSYSQDGVMERTWILALEYIPVYLLFGMDLIAKKVRNQFAGIT